jgi:proton-dependent oligopeptide transporter, POT family
MTYPRQIKFIIGNEICERFSYYGMVGILELYMADRLKMGGTQATEVLHLFGTAVYFLPLLGGWIADRWLGRYWTILSISLFYCLGHGTLAAFEGSKAGLFAGLTLIAIGAGGIKPCVSAFVGDQFGAHQEHLLTKIYGWFYWSINLGSAAAFFIVPWVHVKAGYAWAFGIPGIAMALATLIFWLGRKEYVRQPPSSQTPRSVGEKVQDRWTLFRIGVVFFPISMFWALYNQVYSNWVLQGRQMTPFHVLNGETMQGAGAVLVMIWTPILTLVLYPLAERFGCRPTPLRRMALGMLFGAVAFVISGLIQARMDRGQTISILWQLAPYVVLEAGEVLVSATALEFAFEQAPQRLKSVVMSMWLVTISAGNFFIAVFTGLNEHFLQARGAAQIYLYAGMLFVVAGIFMVCAKWFRGRERTATAAPAPES